MAVFGVPVVHEDDALRAVRAAVAVHDASRSSTARATSHLEVRIGINTGEVVTGDPSAGHGFVSGDAVAVGKRLEQAAAPGEIVLGESTHRLVGHAVRRDAARAPGAEGEGRRDDRVPARVRRSGRDRRSRAATTRRSSASEHGARAAARRLRARPPPAARPPRDGRRRLRDRQVAAGARARPLARGQASVARRRAALRTARGRRSRRSARRSGRPGRDESVLEGSSYEVFAATREPVRGARRASGRSSPCSTTSTGRRRPCST